MRVYAALLILFIASCTPVIRKVREPASSKPTRQVKYHFGVRALVDGVRDADTIEVAKVFQEQLATFEPCLTFRTADPIRLDAKWTLGPDATVSEMRVMRVQPENKDFRDCILKQVKLLEFPASAGGRKGLLVIGTFPESGADRPLLFEKKGP